MTRWSRKKLLPKLKVSVVADHQRKPGQGRLVKAVLLFKLLDQRRVEAARPAIARIGGGAAGRRHLELAGAAADPLGGADPFALEARDHLLDRAAGCGLHDDEIDDHDREQGRDDQQHPPDRVGDHRDAAIRFRPVMRGARRATKQSRSARSGSSPPDCFAPASNERGAAHITFWSPRLFWLRPIFRRRGRPTRCRARPRIWARPPGGETCPNRPHGTPPDESSG